MKLICRAPSIITRSASQDASDVAYAHAIPTSRQAKDAAILRKESRDARVWRMAAYSQPCGARPNDAYRHAAKRQPRQAYSACQRCVIMRTARCAFTRHAQCVQRARHAKRQRHQCRVRVCLRVRVPPREPRAEVRRYRKHEICMTLLCFVLPPMFATITDARRTDAESRHAPIQQRARTQHDERDITLVVTASLISLSAPAVAPAQRVRKRSPT